MELFHYCDYFLGKTFYDNYLTDQFSRIFVSIILVLDVSSINGAIE